MSDAADEFDIATDQLLAVFQQRDSVDAQARLRAFVWSIRDAPAMGFYIALEASEQMEQGRHLLAPDLLQDTLRTFELTGFCFRLSRFANESVVRYLHASGDLLAQVVNGALNLRLTERTCSLEDARKKVRDVSETLADALDGIALSNEYSYVADVANRLKHRTLLPGSIKASLDDSRSGVRVVQQIGYFEHDGREHEVATVADLKSVARALQSHAVPCLRALTALLESSDTASGGT